MNILGQPIWSVLGNSARFEQLADVAVVDGTATTGTLVAYDSGALKWAGLSPGADGLVLETNSAQPLGLQWVAPTVPAGSQTANKVFAGPASGAAAAPTFRLLDSRVDLNKTSQQLQDSTNVLSADWQVRRLYDAAAAPLFDWAIGQCLTGGNKSVDWVNRRLYASDGATVNVDYSTANKAVVKLSDASVMGAAADSTKQIVFSLAGSTAGTALQLSTSNTVDRAITFPDASGTVALTNPSASITIGGALTNPIEFGFARGATLLNVGATGPVTPTAFVGPTADTMVVNETATSTLAAFHGLTSLSLDDIVAFTGNLTLSNLLSCTSISAPALRVIGGTFIPTNHTLLTTFSFPLLQSTAAFTPNTFPALTSLSFPAMTSAIGIFSPNTMASVTSMSFPLLATVLGNFAPATMASLTTFSFPSLANIGGTFQPTTMASVVTISLPALANVSGAFSFVQMASLTTVSLPAMVTYGSTITMNSSLGNLTTLTLGTIGTLKSIGSVTTNIANQKLDAASVNGLLALLVSLDGTGGTTLWGAGKTLTINGGTNAAPSGGGVADKATLIARGATVTTN